NNYSLATWAKSGIELHEAEANCAFCGNELSNERTEKLNRYFSNASSVLRSDLQLLRNNIAEIIDSIQELEVPKSKNDFFEFFQEEYHDQIDILQTVKNNVLSLLNYWLDCISAKEEKQIFMPVVIQNYNPVASDEFNQWIEKSN